MKTLNLDSMAVEERTLVVDGASHTVREMTVADFIETTKVAEELKTVTSIPEMMAANIKLINRQVPSLSIERLGKFRLEQLSALSAFVRGEEPPGDEKADAPAAAEGEAGKAQ